MNSRKMQKIKLDKNELIVGKPLPWSVYGNDGKLLLDQGHTLSSEKQIENLLVRGVLREPTIEELNK